MNSKRNAETHARIYSQLVKRILKAAREKRLVTYKKSSMRITANFSLDTVNARRCKFKVLKEKRVNK